MKAFRSPALLLILVALGSPGAAFSQQNVDMTLKVTGAAQETDASKASFDWGRLQCGGKACDQKAIDSILSKTGSKMKITIGPNQELRCDGKKCEDSALENLAAQYNQAKGIVTAPTNPADKVKIRATNVTRDQIQKIQFQEVANKTAPDGDLGEGTIYRGSDGNFYISKVKGGCTAETWASCYKLSFRDGSGNDLMTSAADKSDQKLDELIAKANQSSEKVNAPPADTSCYVNADESVGKTVEICNGSTMKRITYSNGAKEILERTYDKDGNPTGWKSLSLNEFDERKAIDKGFRWKDAQAYKDQKPGKQCKVGNTIDGSRFDCAFSDAMVTAGQGALIGTQAVGSMRITAQGQQAWNQVAAMGGQADVAYDAQADLMEGAGKTQRQMGMVNLVAGMSQMLAATKALNAKKDLELAKANFDASARRKKGESLDGDGTVKDTDGYVGGETFIGRKGTYDDANQKLIKNFELNNVATLSKMGANDVRAVTDDGKAANKATLMRDKEIALKEQRIKANADQILQAAIQEQIDAAGRALVGGVTSAASGLQQRAAGKEAMRNADSLRAIANTLRSVPTGTPPLTLENTDNGTSVGTGGTRNAIVGDSGGPVTSPQMAEETKNFDGGLGGPINTGLPNNNPGQGPQGFFSPTDPLAGAGGGGPSGGGEMGGKGDFAPPPDYAAQNAALMAPATTGAGPAEYKILGEGNYGTPGGAGATPGTGVTDGGLGDLVKSLLREDGNGKKVEDPRDLGFASRGVASEDNTPILDSGTDLFKQISAAYRGKSASGAVGIGPR